MQLGITPLSTLAKNRKRRRVIPGTDICYLLMLSLMPRHAPAILLITFKIVTFNKHIKGSILKRVRTGWHLNYFQIMIQELGFPFSFCCV